MTQNNRRQIGIRKISVIVSTLFSLMGMVIPSSGTIAMFDVLPSDRLHVIEFDG